MIEKTADRTITKGKNKGCGFGCGSLSIIALLFVIGSYFFIQSKLSVFEEIQDAFDKLNVKYGKVESFVPYNDGVIPSERIKKFIELRNSIKSERQELEMSLQNLSNELTRLEDGENFFETMLVINALLKSIPDLVEYVAVRNEKMLESDIGLGEYYYIYVSAYYQWLGKTPGSGPSSIVIHKNENSISIGLTDDTESDKFGEKGRAARNDRITNESIQFMQKIRSNLDSVLTTKNSNLVITPDDNLFIENTCLVNLEGFKEELENSFSPIVNPLEVMFITR